MIRFCFLAFLASIALLPGCATQAAREPVSQDQVTIHESVVSAPPRFEIIKRLWVDSWRTSFGTVSYASRDEAIADFRQQAADMGGNGVINFGCYRLVYTDRLACNGTVVRFL